MVEMEAGRELDALVAEKVMGLSAPWDENTPCPYCGEIMRYCGQRSWCTSCSEWRYGPYKEYSEDISAAWEVVEKLRKSYRVRIHEFGSGWQASLEIKDGRLRYPIEISHEGDESANSDTAPHAFCLAALKAVGVEVEED